MKKINFIFLLFCFFAFYSSQSRAQDQCYPLTPDEIGLIGAGVSYSDLTVWPTSGEVTLTTGVYEMYDFQNCNIVIGGDDVVIRKCRVTWNGNNIGVIRNGRAGDPRYAGLVIEDCELNGQGDVHGLIADAGIWPGRFTMIRTWIYNIGNDVAKTTDGVTIHRCYLGPVFYNPGAHADILQSGPTLQGTEPDPKQIITYNTFHGYHYVTGEHINGAILMDPFYDAVIIGNWFRGCGYQISLRTDSTNNGISHKVRDNIFETDFKYFYAYPREPMINFEWYNNRFSDGSLAPIPNSTILEGSGGTVPDIPYNTCSSTVVGAGSITRDYWTGIDGGFVTDLTNNANYPDNPTGSDELTSLEAVDWNDPSVNANWADDYGQRIYGLLHPQTSGDYTFWIAGDDGCELYLSSDDSPANKTRIAYVDGWTTSRLWSKYSSQKSVAVSLSAGQSYYIEVIHKENGGGDNVAVGWAKPGESTSAPSEVIPGNVLSPFSATQNIPVASVSLDQTSLTLEIGQTSDLTETISPVDATDQTVSWSSSSISIATVDNNGVVSGLGVGQAIITVTTNDGGYTAQCTVTILAPQNTGTITRDYWTGIDGYSVTNLTSNANYPDNPSGSDELTSLEAVDWNNPSDNTGWADEYGQRIYGFLHPQTTGDYTFWISGDNWSELFLSSDDDPANETKIAYVNGWTSSKQWDKYSSQKSATISLSAGQKYFIEILHKEDDGGDHVAVGWAKPGETTSAPSEVIPGGVLSPFSTTQNIPVASVSLDQTSLTIEIGQTSDLTETISPVDATDQTVNWSSSSTSIATVDNNGVVSGLSVGQAIITVTTNDGGFTAQCTVAVLAPQNTGTITRDYWTGISGIYITDLTSNANYPDNPSGSDELTSLEAVDWNNPSDNTGWADEYGQRIYGFLHPQTTGDYTFWISGDNWSELFLSSDDDPANETKIAYVNGWTSSKQWDKYSSQKSATISLSAGQKYFIEVLHKEDDGGDHVAVGWAKPGETTSAPSEVIPGGVLSPFSTTQNIPVATVSLDQTSLTIEIGQTSDLTETIFPVDATDKSVTWSSDNTSIATVDANGVVSGLSVGQATITVTTNDGGHTAQCDVSVTEAPVNEGKLYLFEADGMIIENRLFTSINLTSCTNIIVRNCKVVFDRDVGFAFKIAGSSNITVENCDINGSNNACWGMDIQNASDLMISNNDIHHIADDGISMHYVTNVTLQDNKIHHLIAKGTDGLIDGPCYNGHSDGIELNDVHYLYMYRNIIYDVSGTSCFIAGSFEGLYPTNLFIENNIFIGNGVGFVVYFGTVHHVRAYNNIIYNGIWGGLAFNGVNTDVDFKNNICQTININHYGGTWDPVEHRFDHNLISDENTWGGYVFNPNDILAADPMWVNFPAYNATSFPAEVTIDDFRLRTGSPAIDGGTSTGAPSEDIIGAPRPLGAAFDMGVFEMNGITDTEAPTTPTGLTALNATGSSVELQWNPSSDLSGAIYDLYENGILVKSLFETSLSRNGLLCSTNYQYKIQAHDLSGNYSGFSNTVNISTTSDCTPINLALDKPVTVSDNSYDPKENLVDGNLNLYWAADGFPQWAQIDLGANCDLTSVELYPNQGRDYQYIIEVSSDGVNYTTIVDRSNNTTGGTVITDNVNATARYIKLTVTGAATYTGTWCSIKELKVFGNKNFAKALRKASDETGLDKQSTLRVYPNPKSENHIATVELSGFGPNQQITAKVIGILGNTIQTNKLFVDNNGHLKYTLKNTELLNKGVYFILVESKTNRLKTKLIVD